MWLCTGGVEVGGVIAVVCTDGVEVGGVIGVGVHWGC